MSTTTAATIRTATVRRLDKYTFAVGSATRAGHVHTVDVLHLKCSCEAGDAGIRCWHLVAALLAERGCRLVRKKARGKERVRPAGRTALLAAYV